MKKADDGKKKMEQRSLSVAELRATKADDGKLNVKGYAIVYDTWAADGYGGRERVARGAAKKTLKEQPDIRALWNHNSDIVLGRTSNNTLRLKEDNHGLSIDLELPDTQAGRDAHTLIQRGDVSQMSFGFNIDKILEEKNPDDENKIDRTIKEIILYEVSPVTFPFYPTTEIGVRAAMEQAGADDALIIRTLERLHVRKPAEPGDEAHSQDDIKEPPVEGHSGSEQDNPDERNADEPVSADHSGAPETSEELSTETVASMPDPETSTGELFPVSKTLIKSLKRREQTLRQNLDAQFKKIEEEKNEHRST